MPNRAPIPVLALLLALSAACGRTTAAPTAEIVVAGVEAFTAEVLSPASVQLEWPNVDGAESYLLEARYGDGDFLPIVDLPPDKLTFTHFIVPGATQVVYRLSASNAQGDAEVGTLDVSLPEFSPNPVVVESSAFAPPAPEFPEIPVFPTIDPINPDLGAMATAAASFANLNPDDFMAQAESQSSFPQTEIGAEGGEVTLTDPNGVTYTLTFPLDAVDEPTGITLVPIESMSNFPFAGGILTGVQVQPPIPFAGPLKLTITFPSDSTLSSGQLVAAFSVSNLTHELSLLPVFDESQDGYSMTVDWGDTFGLVAATGAEIEAQAARIPTDWRAQMNQQLAALRAAESDGDLEGDARIAAQVLQALVSRAEGLTALPSPAGGGGLAALAIGPRRAADLQGSNAVALMTSIFWSEAVWDFLNQMLPPGAEPPPGSELARSMADWKTRIVAELTAAIHAYMEDHDGCRTGLSLYAEALRQILRRPGTPFQRALATEYRARYGPPPELQCEFRFQITRSSIKETLPGEGEREGDSIRIYSVHSEPWPLELAIREGRLLLRGPVGAQYDTWEWTLTGCPPTVQVRPFPTSLIWITDLTLVFDSDDRVSDFILQGISPDRIGGGGGGHGETDTPEPGTCRLVEVNAGANPTDVWGLAFTSLHNQGSHLDNWVIEGEESFVATDTIAGRIEGRGMVVFTEDTTIVLTVNRR